MATATSENRDRPAAGAPIRFDAGIHCLALDFDGVICDSIAECLVLGYNAFLAMQGRDPAISRCESDSERIARGLQRIKGANPKVSSLTARISPPRTAGELQSDGGRSVRVLPQGRRTDTKKNLPGDQKSTTADSGVFQSIPAAQQQEARRIRNFIRSGEDYVYLFHALSVHADIRDQAAFDSFRAVHAGFRESYFEAFYAQRERMAVQFPERWLGLNPLYPGMREFLLRFKEPGRLFIVSTKRSAYIKQLLDGYGIPFEPSHIMDTLSSGPKSAILGRLIREDNTRACGLFFVDDQVDTLLKISSPDIRCILAGWGYTAWDQIAAAGKAGLAVMDLPQFYRTFLPEGSAS